MEPALLALTNNPADLIDDIYKAQAQAPSPFEDKLFHKAESSFGGSGAVLEAYLGTRAFDIFKSQPCTEVITLESFEARVAELYEKHHVGGFQASPLAISKMLDKTPLCLWNPTSCKGMMSFGNVTIQYMSDV